MPVLVEAISVVVRRDAIDRSYQGGWQGFLSDIPNQTLCMDAEIVRVGFMNPIDVRRFIAAVVERGLSAINPSGAFGDLVVIDQGSGPTLPCDWIEFFRIPFETGQVGLARLKGNTEQTLVCPEGWTFPKSLSQSAIFHLDVELDENYEFLRVENSVDVYRDRRDGREVFMGRTTSP